MKSPRSKLILSLLAIAGLFILSSCTANLVTEIKSDGSGLFSQEYILTESELSSAGYNLSDTLCSSEMGMDLSTMPAGTTVRQEKDGEDIKCIFETQFADLAALKTIYTDYLDSSVNDLSIRDSRLFYDVNLNMGSNSDLAGFVIYWVVKMPGSISDHNASEKSGNTLTWSLPSSGDFNARASSKLGAGGNTIWWVVGIGSACLCLLLVVAVIVLIIVLVRRNKKKAALNVTIPSQA